MSGRVPSDIYINIVVHLRCQVVPVAPKGLQQRQSHAEDILMDHIGACSKVVGNVFMVSFDGAGVLWAADIGKKVTHAWRQLRRARRKRAQRQ